MLTSINQYSQSYTNLMGAIYARVSTEEQATRENSIPAQIRLDKEYAIKNNIEIYDIYVDEAITGQKENREAFQRMIKDALAKKFQIIIVHKFSRFARKVEMSRRLKSQLKKAGVIVVSITEPIEDSPIGFFKEGLIELLDEYYVRNLSEEVKEKMEERAIKGLHMGQMPYGYYVKDGQVYVNKEQANIIRKVFELYNSGLGYFKIARWLNENHIPTYEGLIGAWQTFQVKQMLTNIKYIGKNKWSGNVYNAEFPSIIDEVTYYNTQQQIGDKSSRHTYRGDNYNKFLLLGLLRCGECNSTFRIKLNNAGRKYESYVYMCHSAALKRKGCTFTKLHNFSALNTKIEAYIKDILKGKVIPKNITNKKLIADNFISDRLSRIDKELSRAKEAYLAGIFDIEEYKSTKNKLESEKDILKLELSKMNNINNNTDELRAKIKNNWDEYINSKTIEEKKNILMRWIDTIYMYDESFEIFFYI